MIKKPKILVTYIEAGFGHITSAQSIAESLKAQYADVLDIVETEIMQDDDNEALKAFEKFQISQTKATNKIPHYGDLVFAIMNLGKSPFMKLVHRTLFRKAAEGAIEAFLVRQPDVIISTHYFITFCAIEYKRKYNADVVVVTYDPDNNVHVWWDNRSDIFITNNSIASNEAIRKRKFDYSRIKQVFFTARQCVKEFDLTKEQCRAKYNIPQDKFCIMIADGGYATSKAKEYCKYIVKHVKKPITVLLLAGKNKKLYDYFTSYAKTLPPHITLIPFEFTENVHELYASADLFVTKAGPNSVIDCLFVGTPIMIDNCPHPIERATYKLFVKNYHCGIAAFNKQKANRLIRKYIDDPQLLEEYKQNICKNLDKNKDGSKQIAEIVYEQVKNKIEIQQENKTTNN